jgi:hypothetical protein
MKRKRLREIVTRHGLHGEIAKEVGCHVNTVKNSLKGVSSTPLNLTIRELAKKKYGGKYM